MGNKRRPADAEWFLAPRLGRFERQAARVARLTQELESPEPGQRAAAVRQLCPCGTHWVVPVKQIVVEMSGDPDPTVRRAAEHVLFADSRWGHSREDRRCKTSWRWRRHRPRVRGWRRRQLPCEDWKG